ncbi:MAG: DUF1353 domain-containing protein [Proteobacteria bacterium]|nr:DUF1353 domain-containing protein [Pseudomonadota bacterium]
MAIAADLCGFAAPPMLAPLRYASGLPVMRGDVALLYYAVAARFWSAAAGQDVDVPAFDPAAFSDDELAGFAVHGAEGVTDLASIPAWARMLFPPNGRYLEAALKHDVAYASSGYGGLITRAQADGQLLADMQALGCTWAQRTTIYTAVRLGGAGGWGH